MARCESVFVTFTGSAMQCRADEGHAGKHGNGKSEWDVSGAQDASTEEHMQVVAAMLVLGALGGVAGCALAWRWPWVSAPRISARAVVDEARENPTVRRALWSRVGPARLSSYALGAALIAASVGGVVMGLVLWMMYC